MAPRKEPKPVSLSLSQAYPEQFARELAPDQKKHESAAATPVPDSVEYPVFTGEDLERVKSLSSRLPEKSRPSNHETLEGEKRADEPVHQVSGRRAAEYGNWWHESMQFFPWKAGTEQIAQYQTRRLALLADADLQKRGAHELGLLAKSELFTRLNLEKSIISPEIAFSRWLGEKGLQDGIIDLVWGTMPGRSICSTGKRIILGGGLPRQRISPPPSRVTAAN